MGAFGGKYTQNSIIDPRFDPKTGIFSAVNPLNVLQNMSIAVLKTLKRMKRIINGIDNVLSSLSSKYCLKTFFPDFGGCPGGL